jgi:hypothetical protein
MTDKKLAFNVLARPSPAQCIYRNFLKVPGRFCIPKMSIQRTHEKIR